MINKIKNRKNSEGFTIIEVLIVLAIAALILLIVFLAVPALQRSSRNTQRNNDAAALASAINNFQTNNGGTLPTDAGFNAADTTQIYVGCTLAGVPGGGTQNIGGADKTGTTFDVACAASDTNYETAKTGYYVPATTKIYFTDSTQAPLTFVTAAVGSESAVKISNQSITVALGYDCNPTSTNVGSVTPRDAAVLYVVEAATGNGSMKCVEG